MLYIPKIDNYLEVLTNEEVKSFVAINFGEFFKFIREEQNLTKVAKSLYILLTTPNEAERHAQPNSSNNFIHHYNVEILIQNYN